MKLCFVRVILLWLLGGLGASLGSDLMGAPQHALSLGQDPLYARGFRHFGYADPKAVRGGTVALGVLGDFDTLNPFGLKGVPASFLLDWVFERLAQRGEDEPFALYCLLCETVDVAADGMSMQVRLRSGAKFADGKPVTAADVVFSFNKLISKESAPLYRTYWADVETVKALDPATIVFKFKRKNRELPLILLELYVLPRHVYGQGEWGRDFAGKAVGSGPYVVSDLRRGAQLTLERQKTYWGDDVDGMVGRYNFQRVIVKYFKDQTTLVEAFKKGDFDFYPVNAASVWAKDLEIDRVRELRWIVKDLWDVDNNQGAQGFVMNLRRPKFQDIRIRKAFALAFDFEWLNKNIFYQQYSPSNSFFENSVFEAQGVPSSDEMTWLDPLRSMLRPEVFSDKSKGDLGHGMDLRGRLKAARDLLSEAGYKVQDNRLVGPGGPLDVQFLLADGFWTRIVEPYQQNLKRLGIATSVDVKEPAVFQTRVDQRDFDVIVERFGQSESPGNEQGEMWGSAAAAEASSRNTAGLASPAVDRLVEAIVTAPDRKTLEAATRALDRVLYHEHFMVHHWHLNKHRVAYWRKFGRPERLPKYYLPYDALATFWIDPAQEKDLESARQAKKALPSLTKAGQE